MSIEAEQGIQLKVEISKVIHYNDSSMWGMFGCYPLNNEGQIALNRFNNFTIRGTTKRLNEGQEYEIVITGPHKNSNPQYDDYYEIIEVKPEKLDTVEAQHKFLRAMITENQANVLIEAYPNELIVDLIIEGKVDTSKTKGIKKKSLEKIKQTLTENRAVENLIAELADADLTFNAISKIVEHYETADLALAKVQESIYNLCEITGFGFIKVDQYALRRGESTDSLKRIGAAINYLLLQESQDGHVWTDREYLLDEAQNLLKIDTAKIDSYLNLHFKKTGLYIIDNKVSLSKYYFDELDSLIELLRIKENYKPDKNINIYEHIKKAEDKQGFKYTEEQTNMIVEAMEHGVYIINGKAGSGKSSCVNGIVSILEATGKTYMSTALSGKAAQVLSQKGIPAMTIHRALKAKGFNTFAHHRDEPMPYDCVILDETSMVNAGLFYKLVQAVKSGAKLIVVGDSGQLSGIGHGDILRDLLNTKYFKGRELLQIHRQAESSGIIEVASKVREGKHVTQYNSQVRDTYGELKDQVIMTFNERDTVASVLKSIISDYKSKIHSVEDIMDFQVLVANRDRGDLSVKAVNLYAQSVFNDLKKPFIKRGVYEYREGDKVIARGNSYEIPIYHSLDTYNNPVKFELDIKKLMDDSEDDESVDTQNPNYSIGDIYNGTLGLIRQIDQANKCVLVEFQGVDGIVCLDQDNLDTIQMAYAITVHSSQGSSIPNVVFAVDFVAFKLLSKQLIYTGVTRSSEKCVLLAENNALYKAIETDLSGNRRTHLPDLISNMSYIMQKYERRIKNDNKEKMD